MRKPLIYALVIISLLLGNVADKETGKGSVSDDNNIKVSLVDTYQPVSPPEPPTYKERLEQMASRGEIRYLYMKITAYDLSYESCEKEEDDPAYGITYSGEPVREGIVAVDPKVIPIHTKLYIDGYGVVEAKDIGGAIKGNRLDIFMWDKSKAKEWGVQTRKVYILGGRT